MDFSREFRESIYEPWRFEYVAYDTILRNMKQRCEEGWSEQDENDFDSTIRLEADKIDLFVTRKQREIDSRIAYCERVLVHQRPSMTSATTKNLYESMDDALTEILVDLNDLTKFTRYNFLAVKKLVQTHDQDTGRDKKHLLVDISRTKPLDRQRFDVALVKVSTLHDLCRQHGKERTGNAAAGADQSAFERATAKYWVHPDNVTELKAILLFHLPVLVFNPNKPIEPSDSAISSVYFDNDMFDLYSGRLQRDEGAEAVRFRWYGPVSSRSIFIERKTHHASWLDGASVKDRFRVDEDKVDDFVELKYTADQCAEDMRKQGMDDVAVKQNHFIASGIQKSLGEKKLAPVMRVFYNRMAFQVPGDQRLRLSLDTDLTFVREDAEKRPDGKWRRADVGIDYPFDSLAAEEVYRFPYAVLETKLQTHLGQKPPEWLTRLLDSKLVYEVPRFSKFLEGAAHFWAPKLPLLPYWLEQLDLDIRNAKKPTGNFSGLSRSKSLKPLIDGHYRMGYLESQLEKRGTVKRKQSVAEPVRSMSTRSIGPQVAKGPLLEERPKRDSVVIDVNNNNPFDDPVWNRSDALQLDFDKDSQKSFANNSNVRYRPFVTDSRRNTDQFFDTASTEHLFGGRQQTPRSSYLHTEPSQDELTAREDDFNAEEAGEKKKKKKDKKDKKDKKKNDDEEENGDEPPKEKKPKKTKEEKERLKLAERMEPKLFFANERTFINWLQFAALLLSGALTLLNFGDHISTISGGVFFGIAFGFSIYAFIRYRYRAHQIATTPHLRYDDIYGPIGLCILLVGALILNFVLRYQHPSTTTSYLGINNQTGVNNQTDSSL
ncbi:vacuolar transporter chaperone [Apophysomyces sp. BC1034]|nr:vacuolar transporter chaperone [Apophysomyces sp. BC1015]KAG0180920.1 vacuolar transporter chaperone [Apophysomyces sp. BC1021]KAG0189095.1 vacuolar transporter chaperone [Apophysomyces sp. BC1034]